MDLGRRATSGPRLPPRVQGAGGPRRGGASVGGVAGEREGQRGAELEERGGGEGAWLRRWSAGLRAMARRCVQAS
jgi:hypothetical protein